MPCLKINLPRLFAPPRNKFSHAISPDILIHRNGHKQRSRHRLIAINSVGAHNRRKSRHLDTGTRVPKDNDRLPRPLLLVPHGGQDMPQHHEHDVGNHGGQTHLGLAHAAVARRRPRAHPVAKGPRGEEADEGADKQRQVGQPDLLGGPVVRRRRKDLRLRQVDDEQAAAAPADGERGEQDNGKGKQAPGRPELGPNQPPRHGRRLEGLPLAAGRLAAADERLRRRAGPRRAARDVLELHVRRLGPVALCVVAGRGPAPVPDGLGEAEDDHAEREDRHSRAQPEEAGPAGVLGHGAGHDGRNLVEMTLVSTLRWAWGEQVSRASLTMREPM